MANLPNKDNCPARLGVQQRMTQGLSINTEIPHIYESIATKLKFGMAGRRSRNTQVSLKEIRSTTKTRIVSAHNRSFELRPKVGKLFERLLLTLDIVGYR